MLVDQYTLIGQDTIACFIKLFGKQAFTYPNGIGGVHDDEIIGTVFCLIYEGRTVLEMQVYPGSLSR